MSINFNESKSCLKNDFRVYTARCFYNSIKDQNSLYLTLGRDFYWPLEINPPSPSKTIQDDVSFRQDVIFLKKVQLIDMSFVIPRVPWKSGVKYSKYDPNKNTVSCVLVNNVIADQMISSVYMCVDVPKDPEQVALKQPMYNIVNPVEYIHNSDGYSWVLLYQLSDLELYKFSSTDWIPLPTDGRETVIQKKIMTDAYKRSYPYYNFYNTPDVPINGYGSNPVYQLSAYYIMFSVMISPSEDKINPETSFRQIGLMSNPIEKTSSKIAHKKSYHSDEIDLSSGQVLYFENRKAVLKKATQTENIQIILGF
jgi:hypothetical protein